MSVSLSEPGVAAVTSVSVSDSAHRKHPFCMLTINLIFISKNLINSIKDRCAEIYSLSNP